MEDLLSAALKNAFDFDCMRDVFAVVVQERFGKTARLLDLKIEYLHERIIRYVAQIGQPPSTAAEEWRLIGKVFGAPDKMQHSFDSMQHLWANGFVRGAADRISIVEPYRVWPELCLLLMEEASGVRLRHMIKDMQATPEHLRLLAAAAVKLHRCPLSIGPPLRVEQLLSSCHPRPQRLAKNFPELAAPINYVVAAAGCIENGFAGDICTLIHGDFHLAHALMENENCRIIDLDDMCCADPAIDLAEVFVFLKRTARKAKIAAYINGLRDEFIFSYGAMMGWEIIGRVPLYESLLNLKRACKCFRVQDESGWQEKMVQLVEQAAACMQVMEQPPGKFDFDNIIARYERCPGTA